MNQKTKNIITAFVIGIFRTLFLIAICYIILKPFISIILSGFMSPDDLRDIRVEKIPLNWSWYYWKHAWSALGFSSFFNSLISTVGNMLLQVFTSVFVGYGLSRFKFRGRNILMAFVVIMMIVPFQVYSISEYLMFRNFLGLGSLINTPYALYILSFGCMGLKHGLYIYVVMSCFNSLPKELEQAAYIDGAGIWRTFISVMLPNARNVIVTIILLSFSWMWTDTKFTSHLNNSINTLPARVTSSYMTIHSTQSSKDILGTTIAQGAAVVIIIIPLVIMFVVCQKSFVKSISHSGLAN